jgi:spore coat protein CotH
MGGVKSTLLAIAVAALALRQDAGGQAAAGRLTPETVQSLGDTPLYDTGALRTIFLTFDTPTWEDKLAAAYRTDVDVPATVVVDGKTYRDVGVHFRGSSSYRMVGPRAKKSLNLTFDAVHADQRLLGYRSLNLLNGNGDPSFVRTVLYTEIARHYGAIPKANFMRVVINGESWGVYINAQQFNSDLTREWYGQTGGARWKVPGSPRGRAGMEYIGADVESYKYLYEIKTKDTPKSWDALIAMFRVLNQTPLAQLEQTLSPLLDIDEVLKFLAIEVVLVNSDGYWTRASDYNIYLDPKGRFHVVPHDVNEALSEEGGFGFRFGGGGGPTLPALVSVDDPIKPLRSRLLQVPALREKYLGYVRDIATTWLDWNRLEPLVSQYRVLIAADMKSDQRSLYGFRGFELGPASIKSFADERRAYLLQAR